MAAQSPIRFGPLKRVLEQLAMVAWQSVGALQQRAFCLDPDQLLDVHAEPDLERVLEALLNHAGRRDSSAAWLHQHRREGQAEKGLTVLDEALATAHKTGERTAFGTTRPLRPIDRESPGRAPGSNRRSP